MGGRELDRVSSPNGRRPLPRVGALLRAEGCAYKGTAIAIQYGGGIDGRDAVRLACNSAVTAPCAAAPAAPLTAAWTMWGVIRGSITGQWTDGGDRWGFSGFQTTGPERMQACTCLS